MKAVLIALAVIMLLAWINVRLQKRPLVDPLLEELAKPLATVRELRARTRALDRPAILVHSSDKSSTSFFGGAPPAFAGFAWPVCNGRPLSFLACIDLAGLPAGHGVDWLPSSGRLLFFYDMEKQPWGALADRGGWKVLHVPASVAFTGDAPVPAALAAEWRVPRRHIEFVAAGLPPCWESPELEALKLSGDDVETFFDMRSSIYGHHPHHQIGGYPDPIQNPEMDEDCELARQGVDSDTIDYEDPRLKELTKGAADWSLLFQIDTDDDLDLMWGDCGMLYFWIRREDAKQLKFDAAWLILQCS